MLSVTRRLRTSLFTAGLATILGGCGDDRPETVAGPSPAPVPLRVILVSPSTVASGANTSITIMGSGFQQGASLTVGGAAVPVVITSAESARATVPPHAPGEVDVAVTNPDGVRGELTRGLRYVELPARLAITGNSALQEIGATTQLTATATFADGRTEDVTRQVRWLSTFPWIATVNAEGLATATGLGLTPLSVQYPDGTPLVFGAGQLTVTPAGSYALSGRVREPGAGSVPVAEVVHVDSGRSIHSNSQGYFWFGGLTGRPRLRVTKQGYEDSDRERSPDEFFDAPLQRVVALSAGGSSYSSTLAPNDLDLDVGGGIRCQPCRVIRVRSATPGAARVTLTWAGSTSLQIWVDGVGFTASGGNREITADINIGSGDTLFFVGRVEAPTLVDYVPITVVVRQ